MEKFKLPETFMGIPTKGAYARLIKEEEDKDREKGKKTNHSKAATEKKKTQSPNLKPFAPQVTTKINLADFIQIPQYKIIIRKEEELKGKNWTTTHFKLAENGLYMPRIDHFMTHYLNVKAAASGKATLYDGKGNTIPKSEAKELWDYLSTNHNGGCYTWLDAIFKEKSGKLYLETDHKVVLSGNKKKLQGSESLLEKCVDENEVYVGLNFNNQGLPTKKSATQDYKRSQNIYFWTPTDGTVAGFVAGSAGAVLGCNEGPSGGGGVLGVFSCAEGAAAPKNSKTN